MLDYGLGNNARFQNIVSELNRAYPNAECELRFGSVFQLLVATILSSQCTDKRVNEVTAKLFEIASTPIDFVQMSQDELEKHIYRCGFYRSKAKNIKAAASDILHKFNGDVPQTMSELTSLAGVGRKTASVVMSVAFNKDAIAVDTHVFRVSHRLGLSGGKTPHDVEKDLTRILREENAEPSDFASLHHLLIFHGRYCCFARKPSCKTCPVLHLCPNISD